MLGRIQSGYRLSLADTASNMNALDLTTVNATYIELAPTALDATLAPGVAVTDIRLTHLGLSPTAVITETAINSGAGSRIDITDGGSSYRIDLRHNPLEGLVIYGPLDDGNPLGVTLAGANTVTADQATKLAGLSKFTLAPGATLVVSDTATNLLAGANATGLAKATSVALIGTNIVTSGQATSLAALIGFVVDSDATLVVSDSAGNLLATRYAYRSCRRHPSDADRHQLGLGRPGADAFRIAQFQPGHRRNAAGVRQRGQSVPQRQCRRRRHRHQCVADRNRQRHQRRGRHDAGRTSALCPQSPPPGCRSPTARPT